MRARFLSGLLLSIAVGVSAAFWHQAAVGGASPAAAPPYLVVIVMDGFRPEYEQLAPMRHLRALMSRGMVYDNAWVGQIESETPASHATIATGVYPRKHGIIGFGWRDTTTNTFTYMPTNLGQIAAGDITRTIERGGVPTISDLIHARDHTDQTISLSGEKLWASAPMGAGADYLLYGWEVKVKPGQNKFRPIAVGPNVPPARTHYASVSAPDSAFAYQDSFAARLAARLAGTLRPRALFVNLPAPDIAGHYFGGLSAPRQMAAIIRGTDYAIGQIVEAYKRLGIFKQTVFVVAADHGMVAGLHRVPTKAIYAAVARAPVNQLDQALLASAGWIWLRDPEHAQVLAQQLAAHHFANVEGVLYRAPARDGGSEFVAEPSTAKKLPPALLRAYLDLADTEASSSGADVILPYRENTTGLPVGHKFSGMHGGFSWGSQHIPLIIAGPGVRSGVSSFPAKLVDIAPTLERLIGLPVPAGVDGVVLANALQHPTQTEEAAQQAVEQQRTADVNALRAHSAAQSK